MLEASILQFMHGNSIITDDDAMSYSFKVAESIRDVRSWTRLLFAGISGSKYKTIKMAYAKTNHNGEKSNALQSTTRQQ